MAQVREANAKLHTCAVSHQLTHVYLWIFSAFEGSSNGVKPSISESDPANTEPENKVKEVLEPAGAITETAAVITHTGQAMDEAAEVATQGMETAGRVFGGVAGGIGMVKAGLDMSEEGPTVKNVTQMALSTISLASAFFPPLAPLAIAAGLINLVIDYATMDDSK